MNRARRRELKRKAGKETTDKINAVETAISGMSSHCSICNTAFDKADRSMLDSWRVAIYSDNTVILTCEKCSESPEK
tara:strand:- start:343 stop:573 length:231 start_codon:yes stop_codon:yes gene_type:complete